LSEPHVQISEEYAAELEQQQLPVEMDALAQKHEGAHQSALQRFDRDKFGTESGASAGTLRYSIHAFKRSAIKRSATSACNFFFVFGNATVLSHANRDV